MHVTSLLRFTLVAMISCAGALARADVLVVDASGAGAFTQISAAVAAAADGDVLLVKSGSYAGFTITNKALDVVADVGATVTVDGTARVTRLAITRSVTLTGLTIRGNATGRDAVNVELSTGSVRVQGCTLEGFDVPDCVSFQFGGLAAVAYQSTDVAFASCTLEGGDAGDIGGSYGERGTEALYADDGRVALYDCTLRAGDGGSLIPGCPTAQGGYAGDGGIGCGTRRTSFVFLSRSSMTGGDGGICPSSLGYSGCGGSAFLVDDATQVFALESTFALGSPGPCLGVAVVLVGPSASFTTHPGNGRRMRATRVVREQQPARIDFFGQPGEQVLLMLADAGRFAPVPSQRGVGLVRLSKPAPMQIVGTIGASGTLSSAWIVPELGPNVQSRRFLLQAQFVDPTGQATLGPPVTLVLVDSAF